MNRFFSKFAGAVVAIALCLSALAPASATLNPTYALTYTAAGTPGQGKSIAGTITLGASDTYVAGGITVTPALLGCSVTVNSFVANSPLASLEINVSSSSGNEVIKFGTAMAGASNMTAAATTKVVTIPTGFTANDVLTVNTAIYVTLNDAATAGGGTGTWAVTDAVSTVKEASASTFTVTAIAAAPTSNGNFVWAIPGLNMEMATATAVAGLVIPFTATCI